MKAILWDMDGTLLNPNGSIRDALDAALRFGGFAPFAPEEVLIGMPLRDILHKRTNDAAAIEAMVEEFRRISYEEAWRMVAWYDGVRKTVAWCREQGWKTAVVTTKGEHEADLLLRNLGDRDLFDAVVGDDDVRALKPDPAPVLEACARVGVAPSDAVMVGDTRYDVEAGHAAGCATIGVAWGHGAGSHGARAADAFVHDARQLRAAIGAATSGKKSPL